MGIGEYIGRVTAVAARHSWSLSQTIVTLLSIVLTFAWRQWPWLKSAFGERPDVTNLREIVAPALGIVFLMRLLCAPYWLHKDLEEKLAAQNTEAQREANEQRRHQERMESDRKTRNLQRRARQPSGALRLPRTDDQ